MWGIRNANKFGNVKQDGFHSKGEAGQAWELEMRKKAGDIKDFRKQVAIELRVHGQKITTYFADFEIEHNDGSLEIMEYKGFFTDYARLKWKLFIAIYEHEHPEIKITMVKHQSRWGSR